MAVTDPRYDVYDATGALVLRKASLERAARFARASPDAVAWDVTDMGQYSAWGYVIVLHGIVPNIQ